MNRPLSYNELYDSCIEDIEEETANIFVALDEGEDRDYNRFRSIRDCFFEELDNFDWQHVWNAAVEHEDLIFNSYEHIKGWTANDCARFAVAHQMANDWREERGGTVY